MTATWIRDGMWDLWFAALTEPHCADTACHVCNPPTKEIMCAQPTTPQPQSLSPSS